MKTSMPDRTNQPWTTKIEKALQTSSDSMGVSFTQVPSDQNSVASVWAVVSARGTSIEVVFHFSDETGQPVAISAVINSCEENLVRRLAETTAELIQKEMDLEKHESSLDEYASQISRDFEELVWTRELASQIQQTDLRSPLFDLVDQLFPTLAETIQASQLALVQYHKSIKLSGEEQSSLPQDFSFRTIGKEILDSAAVRKILNRFFERGRRNPVVKNQCATFRIDQLESFILVPIYARDEEFGWILAINRSESIDVLSAFAESGVRDVHQPEFGTFEAGLMQSTASFIASHTKNSSLFLEQKNLQVGIVRAMVNAVDAKDHYTWGHSDRVAEVSRIIAAKLQLSERECEEIYLSGLLHDVGKIGVPDHILQKKTRLTQQEFELLKQHPVIGYRVLEHLTQISYVLPGVLSHHEKMSGAGYPEGLVGDQISIAARIISVADSFDAMTSDRPYRKGMDMNEARSILRDNCGLQWDPNVLDAFFGAWGDVQKASFNSSLSLNKLYAVESGDQILRAVEGAHAGAGVVSLSELD